MSAYAVQHSSTCNILHDGMNVYMRARLEAGFKNRFEAVEFLPFGERTLAKIESGEKIPLPEEVWAMSRAYRKRSVMYDYCSRTCPIGKEIACRTEEKELAWATLGLVNRTHDLQSCSKRIMEIGEDNKITLDEHADLRDKILPALYTMRNHIQTYILLAESSLLEEETKPLATVTAERRVSYSF